MELLLNYVKPLFANAEHLYLDQLGNYLKWQFRLESILLDD